MPVESWQSADGRDIENELDQAEAYAKEQERQVEAAEESEAPEPQNAPQYGEPKPAPAEHQAVAQALAGTTMAGSFFITPLGPSGGSKSSQSLSFVFFSNS